MEIKEWQLEDWREEYREFEDATARFYKKELGAKEYKGISGGFGSYAQKGGNASMLRLRMPGGRINKEKLEFIAQCIEKYQINLVHFTTCQTVQLHNLNEAAVCAVAVEALSHNILTRGGGGDFPRNVMVSPLAGVEREEYFNVLPYALAASDYLHTLMKGPKLPRKLKVAFSNTKANMTHATFRDLGFAARADGTFDVYSAGGLGSNPSFGVKVGEKVAPCQILYYIKAMYNTFCAYGNYSNRAKARSRYMKEALGGAENYKAAFLEKLKEVYVLEKELDVPFAQVQEKSSVCTKKAEGEAPKDSRVIAQKQPGLYAVKYHPLGGIPAPEFFRKMYELIKDMDQVELRLSPDESVYIINCTGKETIRVLKATNNGANTAFEASVACIGASVCQQGIRDSQALLNRLVEMARRESFKEGVLPQIHISGCPSSCGTHQTGVLGFHGGVKVIEKAPLPVFTLHYNGCDIQDKERLGVMLGVMLELQIPDFLKLLGQTVSRSGMNFEEWSREYPDGVKKIAATYVV